MRTIRSELREYGLQRKSLAIFDNGTLSTAVLKHLLPKMMPRKEIDWIVEPRPDLLVPLSQEEYDAKVLAGFLEGTGFPMIRVVGCAPRAQLEAYAKKSSLTMIGLRLSDGERAALKLLEHVGDLHAADCVQNSANALRRRLEARNDSK